MSSQNLRVALTQLKQIRMSSPEFKGGVNWVEAAKNEVPEYKETLAAGDNQTSPFQKTRSEPALTQHSAMQAAQRSRSV